MTEVVSPSPKDVIFAERDSQGRFVTGKSGNPDGRPKGSVSAITQMKRELEEFLREDMAPEMQAVLQKGIDLAKKGHPGMIKLFMELSLTKGNPDENKQTEKVEIKIGRVDNLPMDLTTNVTGVTDENDNDETTDI